MGFIVNVIASYENQENGLKAVIHKRDSKFWVTMIDADSGNVFERRICNDKEQATNAAREFVFEIEGGN